MPLPGGQACFFLLPRPNPLSLPSLYFFALSLYFISWLKTPPALFFAIYHYYYHFLLDVEQKNLTFFKAAPDYTRDIFRARFRFDPVIPGLI